LNKLGIWVIAAAFVIGIFSTNAYSETVEECEERIRADASLSYAETIVALKECDDVEREYSPEQADVQDTDRNIIRYCDNNYELYQTLGETEFLKMSTHPFARTCSIIYPDSIWNYDGEDRVEVLINWLNAKIEEELVEDAELRAEIVQEAKVRADTSVQDEDRITDMQERIKFLEDQIGKKDALLMEQLKVISDLASMIKQTIFEPIMNYFAIA